jgi:hypothetical protein
MGTSFPDRWSRQRSGSRDCLVSVLYGRRTSGAGSTPPRPLFQRTMAAGRTAQVVISSRSITGSGGSPAAPPAVTDAPEGRTVEGRTP